MKPTAITATITTLQCTTCCRRRLDSRQRHTLKAATRLRPKKYMHSPLSQASKRDISRRKSELKMNLFEPKDSTSLRWLSKRGANRPLLRSESVTSSMKRGSKTKIESRGRRSVESARRIRRKGGRSSLERRRKRGLKLKSKLKRSTSASMNWLQSVEKGSLTSAARRIVQENKLLTTSSVNIYSWRLEKMRIDNSSYLTEPSQGRCWEDTTISCKIWTSSSSRDIRQILKWRKMIFLKRNWPNSKRKRLSFQLKKTSQSITVIWIAMSILSEKPPPRAHHPSSPTPVRASPRAPARAHAAQAAPPPARPRACPASTSIAV